MHDVSLPHGEDWPALGLGTWRMGEQAARRPAEVAALRTAFDIGYRLVDTAEMYGEGGAEEVLGEAIAGAIRAGAVERHQLQVVSKAYPHHADVLELEMACERSLRRLKLDQIDLYLLHWRGGVPLKRTVEGFERLQQRGWIRHWGVSNFDLDDMHELFGTTGGAACRVNQVYYSLRERGVEHDLLPWQRVQQMPLMAYSPIDGGELADHPGLREVAARHGVTPAQVALAWVLAQPGVMAIPKAANALHLRHNWRAASLKLTEQDLAELDQQFPPPRHKLPLAMR
jgi:diketogulonate reductase-like aldo/keto reductase